MNTKIKRSLLQVVAAAAFMLLPLASAHASVVCSEGPVRDVNAGEWQDSQCNCGSGNVSGGVLASTNTFAWLYANGPSHGQVWVQLEMQTPAGVNLGWFWAERAAGGYYMAHAPGGLAEAMKTSTLNYSWTGKYRSICAQ